MIAAASGGLAISACGLSKQFGALRAVDAIDLAIRRGEYFGLLGPNGSGKTTTINMLCSLLRPSAGSASVAGFDVARQAAEVRSMIGLVYHESALDRNLTVWQNLRFCGML